MIKIAIVEDNEDEFGQLKSCIERFGKDSGEEFSVAWYKDGLAFLDKYNHEFDMIFMDINMPYESGLGVAKRLRLIDPDVCLIFVTQMAQYAINAYDVDARDYILKPVIYSAFEFRFKRALSAVRERESRHRYILVKSQKGIVRLDIANIYYIEVIRHTVVYHTVAGDIEAWSSLKNVEAEVGELIGKQFVRCNNCFLVNLQYVERIENDSVFVGGEELKISRSRRKEFMDAFTLYFGGIGG